MVDQVLAEPESKNTAAALALAANALKAKNPNAIMVSCHADHLIDNDDELTRILHSAVSFAQKGSLVLVGAKPENPETGYGYIEKGENQTGQVFQVKAFHEKPHLELAKDYQSSGNHLWNTGIFIWGVLDYLSELQKFLPQTHEALSDCPSSELAKAYASLQSVAVDNAILEKTQKALVIEADLQWQDIGNWNALYDLLEKDNQQNAKVGEGHLLDCKNSLVFSEQQFVGVIGLDNVIVVSTKNGVLVCSRDSVQKVKAIAESSLKA